jgi:hypothetical protein
MICRRFSRRIASFPVGHLNTDCSRCTVIGQYATLKKVMSMVCHHERGFLNKRDDAVAIQRLGCRIRLRCLSKARRGSGAKCPTSTTAAIQRSTTSHHCPFVFRTERADKVARTHTHYQRPVLTIPELGCSPLGPVDGLRKDLGRDSRIGISSIHG